MTASPVRHGALRLPCSNKSLTLEAPTPTNISTKSEPLIEKNGTAASPATALASRVLPEPGGRRSRAPFGIRPPRRWNFCGSFKNSMISWSSCFASSHPATSLNVTLGEPLEQHAGFGLAELERGAAARLHLADEEHPGAEEDDERQPGEEHRDPVDAGGVDLDLDPGIGLPHPLRQVGVRAHRAGEDVGPEALEGTSRLPMRTVLSALSSPVTVFSRIWRLRMFPRSTSWMKRV